MREASVAKLDLRTFSYVCTPQIYSVLVKTTRLRIKKKGNERSNKIIANKLENRIKIFRYFKILIIIVRNKFYTYL